MIGDREMEQHPGDRIVRRIEASPHSKAGLLPWVRRASSPLMREQTAPPLMRYGLTILVLAVLTVILWYSHDHIGLLNIGFLYLIVVIAAATFGGQGPGILASVLGFALFDFFLVPPYLTFVINDQKDLFALIVFLGVSTLVSALLAHAREQARQAQQRANDVSRLYELSQAIIEAQSLDEVLPKIADKVAEVFRVNACWILLPDAHGQLSVSVQAPAFARAPSRAELGMAQWAIEHGSEVRHGNLTPPGFHRQPSSGIVGFVPLRAANHTPGVLGVADKTDGRPLSSAERTVLATFADQVAVALERMRLLREVDRAEMLDRTDKLKSALMSAVSHDLRTPLASIMASVTSLLADDVEWDRETQQDFLQQIYSQARRLNSLVGNLLDMSRIEGGALKPEMDWYSIEEVAQAVVRRLEPDLAEHRLTVEIAENLPLTMLDFSEIDQVLTNLLDNALKYTPPGSHLHLSVNSLGSMLQVTLADDGPGVPAEHLPHLFDKFYQVDSKRSGHGAGLGLAISKGLVEAHGGRIAARNRPGGGLEISFTLPVVSRSTSRPDSESIVESHPVPAVK